MIRTAKHQTLVNDPVIRYKSVEALPGIGPVYGRRLRDAGFNTADKVLEQYLALKRNEQRFTIWLSQVCGANSHYAALCFSGLNEWYLTWGKDNPSIKNPTSAKPTQNHLTNRMLLEQKILQFNFNSSDDRLRNLTQCQAMSLYDISRPQRAIMDTINKSQPNIFNGFQYLSEANLKSRPVNDNKSQPNIFNGLQYPSEVKKPEGGKCHSLTTLMSPVQKSVNFKENEIIDTAPPRKFIGPTSPKRTISPILKSRSLTPENEMSAHNIPKGSGKKSLNITKKINNNFPRSHPQQLNNLNLKRDIHRKYLETESKPKKTFSSGITKKTENSPQNQKSNISTDSKSSSVNHQSTFQNIEKYFDEVQNINKSPIMSTPIRDNRQDSTSSPSISPSNFQNEDSAFDISVESQDEVESIGTETDSNLTESYEVLPRDSTPGFKHHDSYQESDLRTSSSVLKETNDKRDKQEENHKTTTLLSSSSEFCCENSNEDSGLDINSNGLIEFPNESESSGSECPTPVENIDSLSESNADGTYEVNEATDIECTCNFVADESVPGSETVNSEENIKNQTGLDIDSGDKTKRENIRLFCDMLSNDMEQLPMDKFRKLKLKILQLVYAEIDECGSK